VVVRANGHVRAGGMGLVAAGDLAVAPGDATFAFSEVRVGVAPAIIAVPALRVMAPRHLARLALTGEVFDAETAVSSGLLTAAVGRAGLDAWVGRVVAALLRASPAAVAATKRLLLELRGRPWHESMAEATARSEQLFASVDAAEGMAAFLEKRPPAWLVEGP
jgi:methylglutaconyl-CoA hydratase